MSDSNKKNAEIKEVLKRFTTSAFKLDNEKHFYERPIYGTTLYLATCNVELKFGTCKAHVFQDIIHKGYVIALSYGDIKDADHLYTRIHSSCVTSETLQGCDCDCVQQLEGALERISEKGRGILFYLMQEGRGVGYIAKSRDRMLVQAAHDSISTFEAYDMLGLKKDYRQYRNIAPICKLLGIDPEFTLLTNNPDKAKALVDQGLKLKKTETLEFDPGPYNLAYLASKKEAGHILEKTLDTHVRPMQLPEQVVPFKPYALPDAQRFIYVASYFLPIKPIDDEVVISEEAFQQYFGETPIRELIGGSKPLLIGYKILRDQRFLIKVHPKNLKEYLDAHPKDPMGEILTTPYWFRVHVYTDIATNEDFVVLTYGRPQSYDIPVVRLHSESIFNRFPVKDMRNRQKYEASVKSIVKYGHGVIILLYNDGRGSGFGACAEDTMLTQRGYSQNTDESYAKLGVGYDSRDYDAAMMLLKHHLPHNCIQMVMNSPDSLVRKTDYTKALNRHAIEVDKWIFLEKKEV